jgi:sugar lactone lactonase YvrE
MYRFSKLAVSFAAFIAVSAPAFAAEILIKDAKSQPESLAAALDGTLIVGSASTPFVYKIKPGSTTPEVFIDASAEGPGTFFLGQLVDGDTVWSCLLTPVPNTNARHTALIGSNDMAVGPDKALYISDTGNAKIFRLAPGAQSAETWLDNRLATGIDGLTFFNGVLYYNSVFFNNFYRVPVDAGGKAGAPVQIWMDAPVKGIDGLRVANGKMVQAENGSGKIHMITLMDGDRAHITVLKEGLNQPTAMEAGRGELWIANRGAGEILSIPLPK